MTTIISKHGYKVTFSKEFYIIEGNHGNHEGYNRKWTTWYDGYDSANEAGVALANHINELEGLSEEEANVCLMAANYDLRPFRVVTPQELIDAYDNSGSTLFNIQSWSIDIEEIEKNEK